MTKEVIDEVEKGFYRKELLGTDDRVDNLKNDKNIRNLKLESK